ncbi:hypothetical protein [Pseudactinotalea sp.]|uniref:hypothetical protein n=1 Tax=Pseudactinotalea sp. TaxID=1926260 RepID=UPI003B3A7D8D
MKTLIIVTGAEGAGKSTVMNALLHVTPGGAKVDGEDVGQVNPFSFDQTFLDLLWSNLVSVIGNFWAAGYPTVIAGSFLDRDTHTSLGQFLERLDHSATLYVVHLVPSRSVRDDRRIHRSKPTSKERRDTADANYDLSRHSLRDNANGYRYIEIDNTSQAVGSTVATVRAAIPEIYDTEHR